MESDIGVRYFEYHVSLLLKKYHKVIIIFFSLSVVLLSLSLYFVKIEYKKIYKWDRKYYAKITSRLMFYLIPTVPGDSGGKPGFASVYNSAGEYFGTIPIPMVQMADDIKWEAGGASIPAVGNWIFGTKTVLYWNDEQDTESKKKY